MKSYTKKNGEVVKYDQKECNKRHYAKHREDILNDTYICEHCDKKVNNRCRSNHEKTLKHQLYAKINKK